jgi:hypothetical protein
MMILFLTVTFIFGETKKLLLLPKNNELSKKLCTVMFKKIIIGIFLRV